MITKYSTVCASPSGSCEAFQGVCVGYECGAVTLIRIWYYNFPLNL